VVPLADRVMRDVEPSDNPRSVLGLAATPYLKAVTWEGRFRDVYLIDLRDGSRSLVAERLGSTASLSPGGRYVVYYRDRAWHIFDGDDGATRNLTAGLETPFANEDHDYPRPAPGYGVADWIEGDRAVLIYDKYDLWLFPTGGGEPLSLTEGRGRRESTTYRVIDLDDDRDYLRVDERLLLSAYHHERKTSGFCEARAGQPGVRPLVGGQYKLSFVAKARKAERLVYTRESYNEFPDLRVAERSLDSSRRLSDANPTIADFAWGEAELVEWRSADGIPLQGGGCTSSTSRWSTIVPASPSTRATAMPSSSPTSASRWVGPGSLPPSAWSRASSGWSTWASPIPTRSAFTVTRGAATRRRSSSRRPTSSQPPWPAPRCRT